jgi:hypothetical protein
VVKVEMRPMLRSGMRTPQKPHGDGSTNQKMRSFSLTNLVPKVSWVSICPSVPPTNKIEGKKESDPPNGVRPRRSP